MLAGESSLEEGIRDRLLSVCVFLGLHSGQTGEDWTVSTRLCVWWDGAGGGVRSHWPAFCLSAKNTAAPADNQQTSDIKPNLSLSP